MRNLFFKGHRRGSALVVVLVAVLLGGLGTGSPIADGCAPLDACDRFCPCEEDIRAGDTVLTCTIHAGASDGCDGSDCSPEPDSPQECPPDCPDCACCPGALSGLVPPATQLSTTRRSVEQQSSPTCALALTDIERVYRPPQLSLS